MRPERNPLDLNNLPEDYSSRDGKQVAFDDTSPPAGYRKKKSGAKDGKDECGKVYECRFCSLKFCKSQALGGHMNRHRQERETETLNRARQLVFSNDNLAAPGPPHLGCHPITAASYHPAGHIGDPYRSVYSPRLFSGSSSTMIPPPQPPPPPPPSQPPQPYPYPSPSRLTSYPTQYPPHPMNEYYVGHVLTTTSHSHSHSHSQYPHQNLNYLGVPESNYTCIGAPVGHGFLGGSSRGGGGGTDMNGGSSGGRDGSLSNQEEGLNWGRSYAAAGTQPLLDPPSSINRFQDGF